MPEDRKMECKFFEIEDTESLVHEEHLLRKINAYDLSSLRRTAEEVRTNIYYR